MLFCRTWRRGRDFHWEDSSGWLWWRAPVSSQILFFSSCCRSYHLLTETAARVCSSRTANPDNAVHICVLEAFGRKLALRIFGSLSLSLCFFSGSERQGIRKWQCTGAIIAPWPQTSPIFGMSYFLACLLHCDFAGKNHWIHRLFMSYVITFFMSYIMSPFLLVMSSICSCDIHTRFPVNLYMLKPDQLKSNMRCCAHLLATSCSIWKGTPGRELVNLLLREAFVALSTTETDDFITLLVFLLRQCIWLYSQQERLQGAAAIFAGYSGQCVQNPFHLQSAFVLL